MSRPARAAKQAEWHMKLDERRELEALRRCEGRMAPADFSRLCRLEAFEQLAEIQSEGDGSVVDAAAAILAFSASCRAGQYSMRYELEDRVDALETQMQALGKPRVRVPSGRKER